MTKKELNPIDYMRMDDGSIWIVDQKQDGEIFGKRIYFPDPNGKRVTESGKRYTRLVSEIMPIDLDKIEEVLYPRDGYQAYKPKLESVWKKYVQGMLDAGIPDEAIGIFGSQLLGFPLQKDIDFVIYGAENIKRYRAAIGKIRKTTKTSKITPEHIKYQTNKYSHMYNEKLDLEKAIARNDLAIQVDEGVLSTPRFVDERRTWLPALTGNNQEIECIVVDGVGTACVPRYATVDVSGDIYTLWTPFWLLNTYCEAGDKLLVFGDVDPVNKNIVMSTKAHWFQYI